MPVGTPGFGLGSRSRAVFETLKTLPASDTSPGLLSTTRHHYGVWGWGGGEGGAPPPPTTPPPGPEQIGPNFLRGLRPITNFLWHLRLVLV